MKQSRKITALLAAMLVLIMMLLFANQGMLRQNAQVAVETATPIASPSATISPLIRQSTSTPVTLTFFTLTAASAPDFLTHVALTLTARPTFTPEATSTLEPHACVFPLAQTTRKESMPQNYTFSEPQVVDRRLP